MRQYCKCSRKLLEEQPQRCRTMPYLFWQTMSVVLKDLLKVALTGYNNNNNTQQNVWTWTSCLKSACVYYLWEVYTTEKIGNWGGRHTFLFVMVQQRIMAKLCMGKKASINMGNIIITMKQHLCMQTFHARPNTVHSNKHATLIMKCR